MSIQQSNSISAGMDRLRGLSVSPAIQALMLGGGAYAATRFGWKPFVSAAGSLSKGWATKRFGLSGQAWDLAMQRASGNEKLRARAPAVIGALAAAGALGINSRSNEKGRGLLQWSPSFKTNDSLMLSDIRGWAMSKHAKADSGYDEPLDMSCTLNTRKAAELFNGVYDADMRWLCKAIVRHAAVSAGTANIRAGQLYDAAVRKLVFRLRYVYELDDSKVSQLADSMAGLFTKAVLTLLGMDEESRASVTEDGTWNNIVCSIFGE